jgi:tRNA A37 threonylcarbamoyladenosine biosynthesis protein TsaE
VADALEDNKAIVAIEWADLFPALWPHRVMVIEICHGEEGNHRHVSVWCRGLDVGKLASWLNGSQAA